jgi:hypothetical protein
MVDESARLQSHPAFHYGQVPLADCSPPELITETCGSFGCPAKENDAGNRSIDSMHESQVDSTRLLEIVPDPSFPKIQEAWIPRFIALNQKPCWLIKNEQMVVLMQQGPGRVEKAAWTGHF